MPSRRDLSRFTLLPALSAFLPPGVPAAVAETAAIQSQDSNVSGVTADLIECKRKDGVLTVRVRFTNTGEEKMRLPLIQGRN